jgi:hypothetical protein
VRINNGQSRDTGNIGMENTQDEDKQIKRTQHRERKERSNTNPTSKRRGGVMHTPNMALPLNSGGVG